MTCGDDSQLPPADVIAGTAVLVGVSFNCIAQHSSDTWVIQQTGEAPAGAAEFNM